MEWSELAQDEYNYWLEQANPSEEEQINVQHLAEQYAQEQDGDMVWVEDVTKALALCWPEYSASI